MIVSFDTAVYRHPEFIQHALRGFAAKLRTTRPTEDIAQRVANR